MTGFFRDRGGVAIVDYGFAATLLVLTSHLAVRWGDVVSGPLRHMLAAFGTA